MNIHLALFTAFQLMFFFIVVVVYAGSPCGGNVTAPSGCLSGVDGDNDGNYDIFRECLWTLIAPEDYWIVVQLLFLSLQDNKKCETEKLLVSTVELQWIEHIWNHKKYARDRGSSSL